MPATAPVTPEPRRLSIRLPHWGWFLLATAVLVVVAVGLHVSLPMYRQHVAVRQIEEVNGIVEALPRGPAWMRSWADDGRMMFFDEVYSIDLSGTLVTDAALVHVRGLPGLQRLGLAVTHVTDVGLADLRGLTKLKVLRLDFTQVTDAGLEHLKGLQNLRILGLEETAVTDAGIDELKRVLPGLEVQKPRPSLYHF